MQIRDHLPAHPPSTADRKRATRAILRLDGLVARPSELTPNHLARLPRTALEEPFVCEEGWSVPNLRWAGVRLADVLALGEPLPDARYVRAGSGAWVVPIALTDVDAAFVCDALNGEPLTIEHGAPWRLVLSGGACYTSVKWLDHLELTVDPGDNDAQRIARSRLSAGAARE
ncbi:MAG TPA: molybdopterin-dependent oxidoreductase [Chloroflexota bacterium]|jgi:DMSO/TMAO reductase YedYZ molybdopterin-dependent catalytic subunit